MYYISGSTTVKVDRVGDTYVRRKRPTKIKSLKPERLSVIIPDSYTLHLDQKIERPEQSLPAVVKKEDLPLELGKLYRLTESRVYRLEKIINTEEGVSSNIVSVYQGEEDGGKYALSESDCEFLGIEYKEGLFPLNVGLKLKPYDPNEKEFLEDDLSTYPTSSLKEHSKTIRYMVLCLEGFTRTTDSEIIQTPGGDIIDIELFIATFKVTLKNDIPPISGYSGWSKGEELSWSFISNNFKGSERANQGELCDISGKIYLILKLVKNDNGISPYSLKGKKPGDLFKVSWNSSFAITNEQEEEKTEKSSLPPKFDRNIFVKDKKAGMYWRAVDLVDGRQVEVPLVTRKGS